MQLFCWVRQLYRCNFKTSLPRLLHCGNHVLIARNQNYPLYGLGSSKICDIQSYSHINAFLFKYRRKIVVRKWTFSGDWDIFWLPASKT